MTAQRVDGVSLFFRNLIIPQLITSRQHSPTFQKGALLQALEGVDGRAKPGQDEVSRPFPASSGRKIFPEQISLCCWI